MKTNSQWFTEARFGLFIHWGLYAVPGRHEWVQHLEGILPEDYRRYFDAFEPDLFAPADWAKLAADCGMGYVVITSKHHEGFCLWDSKFTNYKANNTPARRDLLAPILAAFREKDIRTGLYYSLIDWHHPQFELDSLHPISKHPRRAAVEPPRNQKVYTQYMRDQVRELLTGYGDIDALWFDFSYPDRIHWPVDLPTEWVGKSAPDWESEALWAMIRGLRPDILVNDRLGLPDRFDLKTPEQFIPADGVTHNGKPVLWEACHTLSGSWGYNRDELTWKSTSLLVKMLVDTVSKGGNFILNIGPDSRGQIDPRAVERLRGIARWMKLHAASIHGCGAVPKDFPQPPRDARYTYHAKTGKLYVHCFSWPFAYLELPGLKGRVQFARLLSDGSEISLFEPHDHFQQFSSGTSTEQAAILKIPVIQPDEDLPVIELTLL